MSKRRSDDLGTLLQRVSASLLNVENRVLARHDITIAQWRVLDRIVAMDGGRVTDLVRALEHDQAAVSRIIKRLQDSKFVTREKDAQDGRSMYVVLTDRGKEVHQQALKTLEPLMDSVQSTLMSHELDTLHELLERLLAKTDQVARTLE